MANGEGWSCTTVIIEVRSTCVCGRQSVTRNVSLRLMGCCASQRNCSVTYSPVASSELCIRLIGLIDEPNARGALIWIVGEYAEKINDAGEILGMNPRR